MLAALEPRTPELQAGIHHVDVVQKPVQMAVLNASAHHSKSISSLYVHLLAQALGV